MVEYTFYYDGGHGWLQVPRDDLIQSGFSPSTFSYVDDQYYYLEEDCDASGFLATLTEEFKIVQIPDENETIRKKDHCFELQRTDELRAG